MTRQQNKDDKKKKRFRVGNRDARQKYVTTCEQSSHCSSIPLEKAPFAKSNKEISLTNVDGFAAEGGKKNQQKQGYVRTNMPLCLSSYVWGMRVCVIVLPV